MSKHLIQQQFLGTNQYSCNWFRKKTGPLFINHLCFYSKLSDILCLVRTDSWMYFAFVVNSDASRSKIFDLGWVSHVWFGFGFGKFPLKITNFSIFFPSDQKKIFLGWVKKYPGQRQRLASYLLQAKSVPGLGRVRSGPISSG